MKYLYTIRIKGFPPKGRPIRGDFLETGTIVTQEVEFKKMNKKNKNERIAMVARENFKGEILREFLEVIIEELKTN